MLFSLPCRQAMSGGEGQLVTLEALRLPAVLPYEPHRARECMSSQQF